MGEVLGLVAAVIAILAAIIGTVRWCTRKHRAIRRKQALAVKPPPVDAIAEGRAVYRESLRALEFLPITAIVDSGTGAEVTVGDVYTPQSLAVLPDPAELQKRLDARKLPHGQEDAEKHAEEGDAKEIREEERRLLLREQEETLPSVSIDRFLKQHRLAVILGDPGMGKSTLASYRTVEALDALDKDPKAAFPIYLEIKRYIHSSDSAAEPWLNVLDYVVHSAAGQGWTVSADVLQQRLEELPSLVIFDGLDEAIDRTKRREVVERIVGFARSYPKARILITSRIAGFEERSGGPLRSAGFAMARLQPLNRDSVLALAGKVAEHLPSLQNKDSEERAVARIMTSYDKVESVRSLCGNPLLLTMMTPFAASETLPESRAKLYEKALEKLVYGWEERVHGPGEYAKEARNEIYGLLSSDERIEMLRRAARFMADDDARLTDNLIGEQDLRAAFSDFLENVKGVPKETLSQRMEAAVELFRGRNRILADAGQDEDGRLFGFLHRSFLEYLLATDLENRYVKQPGLFHEIVERFRDKALVEVWQEPLLLLIGRLFGVYVDQAIAATLPPQVKSTADLDRLIFALACFKEIDEAALTAAQAAAEQTVALIVSLFDGSTPDAVWGTREHANKRIVRFLPLLQERPTSLLKNDALFQEENILLELNPPRFYRAHMDNIANHLWDVSRFPTTRQQTVCDLVSYTLQFDKNHRRRVAMIRFAEGLSLQGLQLKPLLMTLAVRDEGETVRGKALVALAHIAADDPEVRALLRARALEDEGEWVRGGALETLARIAADDPEVRALLRARALEDEGETVRRGALEALARIAADDPEVRALLRARALEDEGEEVRGGALEALARIAADDPEVRALLRARALEDESEWVRRYALETFAHIAADDPEVRALLRARALEDESEWVRRGALQVLASQGLTDFGHDCRSADQSEDRLLHLRALEAQALLSSESLRDVKQKLTTLGDLHNHFSSYLTEALLRERDSHDCRLATRDLDAVAPWIPLGRTIDQARIEEAGNRLNLTEDEVRARYEAMVADGIPWLLDWKKGS